MKIIRRFFNSISNYSFFSSFRHTINYFGAVIAIQILAIVSLPVYTSYFTPSDFGIYSVFSSVASILFVLSPMNLHTSIARYYFEEKADYKEYLGTVFMIMSICAVIILSIFWWHRAYWAAVIGIPVEVFFWLCLFSVGHTAWHSYEYLFIALEKSGQISRDRVVLAYLKLAISVCFLYFIISSGKNYMGRIIGEAIVMVLGTFYFVWNLSKHMKFNPQKHHVRYSLYVALPLIPHSLSSLIVSFFDQFFIISAVGTHETGVYSFAYKLAMILIGFNTAIISGTTPFFYKKLNRKSIEEVDGQAKSIFKFMAIAAVFLILFSKELVYILAQKKAFYEALPLVPVLILAFYLHGVYVITSRIIVYTKRNIYISIITLVGGVSNIILNAVYIPTYTYEVAAYTTLLSFFIMFLLTWLTCKWALRVYTPPMKFITLYGSYVLGIGLMVLLENRFLNWNLILIIFIKGTVFLIVAFALFGDKIMAQWHRIKPKKNVSDSSLN